MREKITRKEKEIKEENLIKRRRKKCRGLRKEIKKWEWK